MDATTKPGLFRVWYDELKNFSTKTQQGGILPHLEIGASAVTVFVSSYFAANLADAFAVILAYGPHRYFHGGLRVVNWKHGLLSNGEYLSLPGRLVEIPTTLILWIAAICAADFCSMILGEVIRKNGRWMRITFRVVGGAALLAFAVHLYRQGSWGLHPVPLSALLGGAVLVWKGFASIFTPETRQTTA